MVLCLISDASDLLEKAKNFIQIFQVIDFCVVNNASGSIGKAFQFARQLKQSLLCQQIGSPIIGIFNLSVSLQMSEHFRQLQVRPDLSNERGADIVSSKTSGLIVQSFGRLGEFVHSLFGLFFSSWALVLASSWFSLAIRSFNFSTY